MRIALKRALGAHVVAVVLAFTGAGRVSGSVNAPSGDADDVVNWAINTGRPGEIKTDLAELLNLAHHSVPIRERAFTAVGETHLLAASLETGGVVNEGFVIISRISQKDGTAIIWRGSLSGQLLMAVLVDPAKGISVLPVEAQVGEFLAEREYFRRKMRESQGK